MKIYDAACGEQDADHAMHDPAIIPTHFMLHKLNFKNLSLC